MSKIVAVVMGSLSDFDIVNPAIEMLNKWEIPCETHVLSAHRTPRQAAEFAKEARDKGVGVIIAAAGMAAHLAGSLAAQTTLPVIGIPVAGRHLDGMDALLSTVMMPPGIPVATVAINGAKNAALLAIQMLAIFDDKLAKKLEEDRESMEKVVAEQDDDLRRRVELKKTQEIGADKWREHVKS